MGRHKYSSNVALNGISIDPYRIFTKLHYPPSTSVLLQTCRFAWVPNTGLWYCFWNYLWDYILVWCLGSAVKFDMRFCIGQICCEAFFVKMNPWIGIPAFHLSFCSLILLCPFFFSFFIFGRWVPVLQHVHWARQ